MFVIVFDNYPIDSLGTASHLFYWTGKCKDRYAFRWSFIPSDAKVYKTRSAAERALNRLLKSFSKDFNEELISPYCKYHIVDRSKFAPVYSCSVS